MQNALAGMQAELRQALENVDYVVPVSLSIATGAILSAIAESQQTGEPATVNPESVTANVADADAIHAALQAGKRIRFDLTAETGGGNAVRILHYCSDAFYGIVHSSLL